MTPPRLLLLCAHTARSVAYLQALAAAGLVPDHIIAYGQAAPPPHVTRHAQHHENCGLVLPQLDESLIGCLERLGWAYERCSSDILDSTELLGCIERGKADLIVYSGQGGQLVPPALLQRCPVLHVHSGWLPDYRGSTTLYYQILEQRQCAASALLLNETIDTGPVVARKHYPLPAAGMDVDYLYDNAIRADLLVEVLLRWRANPASLAPLADPSFAEEQPPYYIIHPLLKHLALLTIDQQEPACE
ncbi:MULTISPECIES: formyltransferase family protein [unclassified Pseudomonas]|uniref:formyltransferase family protein n=1 Tax=unclassified Pseudomonas TaxID=196821 RepID=UPI000BDA72E6|nr:MULTISPECIES: formyltransferase family protein [unclassified Pseudomonas]PVZ16439.1 methionyl-tRNA formyltransferase [Pseudomonas sp. URIL14HWK12:I12]PVZ25705.1 methionyl-tRNA formyltransferase [Pseudomonas sp. URIL14HWK12:I10]PVZ36771.1 methionyl-tRNA formyltransferase [Pseudomonas sp. URIL14HWK12:I11]SNZ12646.1 methionyl-tRNA formyltransferase [Pseudomonas sp. URIL14HWK12:I9]